MHYPGSAGAALKVPFKKIQLIVYASFKVFPVIDIEVTNWIKYWLCIFPQLICRFFCSAFRRQTVMFTD